MASAATLDRTAPGRSRIAIARLGLRLAVAGPAAARAPASDQIAAALGEVAASLDPGDASFWVIRRLRLVARTGEADGAAIAAALRDALRAAMGKVLRGELCDGVMRFADRADWLATLLSDHVDARARGHWVYARHAALDALPIALLPRQLFATEPTMALPVLARLAGRGRLIVLAAAIGEHGARALLAAIVPNAGPGAGSPDAGTLAAAMVDVAQRSPLPVAGARTVLVAIGELAEAGRGSAVPSRQTIDAAERRARLLARGEGDPHPGRAGSERPDAATAESMPVPVPRPRRAGRPDAPGPALLSAYDTPHAGIFLLWRSVRELGLEAMFPDTDPGPAALTLAATLAGPGRVAAWNDPALHWLAGYRPGSRDRPRIADRGMAARFAALMAEHARPRVVAQMTQRAKGLAIDQDARTEDWLAVRPEPGPAVTHGDCRSPARDIAFFGLARAPRRRPWALLARAAYADFARRLNGLDRSTAAWLWTNLLGGWGRIEPGEPARLVMPRVPLDLVLRMTGLDGARFTLGDGRVIEVRLAGRGD